MTDEPPLLAELLAASHRMVPDDLPQLVQRQAPRLGAREAVLHLADLDQRHLVALATDDVGRAEVVSIDGTVAGRSFRSLSTLVTATDDGATTVWVPVLDGTERLGVVQLVFDAAPAAIDAMEAFAGLLGELVMTKSAYGDFFACARRREPLTVGSELLWQLLPPLTFSTDDLVITAGFAPTARLGGDAFDYGVNRVVAQVAVFDALGHDLAAGLLATTAVAAFRNARRSQLDLTETAGHIGANISGHFDASKFVTGIVATLEMATGRLEWCSAGHPSPLLLRNGHVVKHLDGGTGQPFGVGPAGPVLVEHLEPGDQVVLYTDGITEARGVDGEAFGLEKLVDLLAQSSLDHPPPEVIRQLLHKVEAHSDGRMRDDATVVVVEWRGAGSSAMV